MKFPVFKTMISAIDFEEELNKLLNLTTYSKEKAESVFGVKIILNKDLPPGSALLVNKDGKIVAVIQDQKLVEISQDSAITTSPDIRLL